MTQNKPLVEMKNMRISFGGIHAVDDVSIDLNPGEVVGLLGHNGAGKTTLIKMLSGAYAADSGEIWIDGKKATIRNPRDARAYSIETIYQKLALSDNLDAASNLFLGRELVTGSGMLDDDAMEAETRKILIRRACLGALGGATAVRGHRSCRLFQRAHPDHGRADSRAGSARNRHGV